MDFGSAFVLVDRVVMVEKLEKAMDFYWKVATASGPCGQTWRGNR
jgi:hypothetical protein